MTRARKQAIPRGNSTRGALESARQQWQPCRHSPSLRAPSQHPPAVPAAAAPSGTAAAEVGRAYRRHPAPPCAGLVYMCTRRDPGQKIDKIPFPAYKPAWTRTYALSHRFGATSHMNFAGFCGRSTAKSLCAYLYNPIFCCSHPSINSWRLSNRCQTMSIRVH